MKRAFLALAGVTAVALATAAAAGAEPAGFRTSEPPLLTPVKAGVAVEPIISVGDTLKDGYMFEAIPDGISVVGHGVGRADVYVNHETSTVPFPFTPATGVGFNDFTNAMLSNLKINAQTHGVLEGSYVIPSEANYQRFCSNFLAGEEHGFERDLIFANEEATDVVNRVGTAWPATPANGSQPEQAGVVVAYDVKTGAYKTIYGMGRHNHENSVAIPGYGHPVVLSGDDTFTRAELAALPLHAPAARPRSGTTPARCGRSSRTSRRSTTTATSPSPGRSPAASSRCRGRSQSATRPGSRTGRTRTACSSSSASRTSPTTGRRPTSCTSPTPASPVRCRAPAPRT